MEKSYLFILLLLIITPNYAYCQLKDEAIQVTFTTEIKEVKLINDTLISQLKDIIFNKNEEFSKVLKEYTYIDVEPTDWNNIYIFISCCRNNRFLSYIDFYQSRSFVTIAIYYFIRNIICTSICCYSILI